MIKFERKSLEYKNFSFLYDVSGNYDSENILFFIGGYISSGNKIWVPQLRNRFLTDNFKILMLYEYCGFNKDKNEYSEVDLTPYAIHEVLEKEQYETVSFITFSFGSRLADKYLQLFPCDKVKKVFYYSPVFNGSYELQNQLLDVIFSLLLDAKNTIPEKNNKLITQLYEMLCKFEKDDDSSSDSQRLLKSFKDHNNYFTIMKTLKYIFKTFMEYTIIQRKKINVSCIVARGDSDFFAPIDMQREVLNLYSNYKEVVFEGNHKFMFYYGRELSKLVESELSDTI